MEHEELGAKLKQLRDEVLRISSQLERLTPKRPLVHSSPTDRGRDWTKLEF
jgi:hypothetical protein